MRVLWFTNVPTGEAACRLGEKDLRIGGWIESLKNEITARTDITLGIAFSWSGVGYNEFKLGNVQYFKLPFIKPTGGLRGRIASLTHQLESLEVVRHCLRVVKDFRPDIIHIFGTEKNYGLIVRETSVPCVVHLQGILNEITKRYFSGIGRMDILRYGDRRKLLKGGGLLHGGYLMKKQARRELQILSGGKFFMGRTEWDREIVKRYAPQAMYYHCDEMLRNQFYSNSWQFPNRSKKIVYSTIGNVCYKGLETLVEAGLLLKKDSRKQIEFRVGGIGASDEVFQIVHRKYGSVVDDFVKPLGVIDVDCIREHLVSADVFVHPSHIDNSPNSVCEAMMVGVPVVSTNVGGIASLLDDRVDGLLVPEGDAKSMAVAIGRFLNDRAFSETVSVNARRRAVERHSRERILNQLIGIYQQIVSTSP